MLPEAIAPIIVNSQDNGDGGANADTHLLQSWNQSRINEGGFANTRGPVEGNQFKFRTGQPFPNRLNILLAGRRQDFWGDVTGFGGGLGGGGR